MAGLNPRGSGWTSARRCPREQDDADDVQEEDAHATDQGERDAGGGAEADATAQSSRNRSRRRRVDTGTNLKATVMNRPVVSMRKASASETCAPPGMTRRISQTSSTARTWNAASHSSDLDETASRPLHDIVDAALQRQSKVSVDAGRPMQPGEEMAGAREQRRSGAEHPQGDGARRRAPRPPRSPPPSAPPAAALRRAAAAPTRRRGASSAPMRCRTRSPPPPTTGWLRWIRAAERTPPSQARWPAGRAGVRLPSASAASMAANAAPNGSPSGWSAREHVGPRPCAQRHARRARGRRRR